MTPYITKGRELELLGFQARLCEFLFDNLETNERIEEGKAIAFIVGKEVMSFWILKTSQSR